MLFSITETINQQVISLSGGYLTPFEAEIVSAFTILILSVILGKIVDFVFEKIFMQLAKNTTTDVDDKILAVLKAPIFLTVSLLGLILSLSMITALQGAMSIFINIIKSVLIIIWVVTAAKISKVLIYGVLGKLAAKTETTLDDELMPLFENITKIVLYFIGLAMILKAWNIDVTPLLASAGIVGIAVAFAAQNTIAHIFGGISVYFDKPFKVGDRIQLESGELGDVIDVGIRSTRIQTLDETMIVIPNDKIANSKIINFNAPSPRMNVKINVGVSYGSDVAKVKKTLLKVAKEITEALKDPEPQVFFTEHGDYSLKFVLITWISNPIQKGVLIDKVNEGIDREFKKAGIHIPFPTQTIYMEKK